MTTDQTSEIDETVIEALRPQSRRYDVAIEDELVLSVLPNGAKTWTWVYDDPADTQRKTLGIYPAMSLADARKALAAEKSSYSVSDGGQEPEFVIRDGRIEAVTPSSPQLPIIAGAILALFAIGVIIYLMMSGSKDSPVDDSSPFIERSVERSTETTIQLPTTDSSLKADATDRTTDAEIATTRVQPGQRPGETPSPEQTTNQPDMTSMTVPEIQATVSTSRAVDPLPEPQTKPVLTTPTNTAQSVTPQSSSTPDVPAADSTVTADVTPATNTQQNIPIVEDKTPFATTQNNVINESNSLVITDTRVARGRLTSAVIEREPIDDLGSSIVGNGTDLQTYFFFTELRKLAGQQVRHRWVHRDRVVAEVPFNVGEAWRWRVYSSKTFTTSMSGEWQVQVVLEDDTVIHNVPFTFIP